ncbi:hypothetical protein ACFWF7_38655 [Nocardia sp. NPDC060256]|uniref:hypothetical protein n=1 Tax=unclassified Nocardia TaxID=2637762 RepID=UPI003660ABA1
MSAADEIRGELEALDAEKQRLRVVDGVLSDMLDAATEVRSAKGYVDDSAEQEKLRHWDAAARTVWAEQATANGRWLATHDRWFAEVFEPHQDRNAPGTARSTHAGIERSR